MHLIVGLGNPDRKYERTRHNAGFLVVDRLASRVGAVADQRQLGALVAKVEVASRPAVLAKPLSYMNLSGQPAASLAGFYKVPVDHMLVVHDDMDLPFGDVRVKQAGGHGGHNGLRDIHRALGPDYLRVRFGVGRPEEGRDPADYVLSKWSGPEEAALNAVVDRAADAVEAVVREGVSAAMNTFNTRTERPQRAPAGAGSQGR
jgi:PTH1 family peptidyl-tRNA hydrolase